MSAPPAGMAPVKIPANLPDLVRTAFNRARASGDVHFFPTQVALINVNSIPFQLRFSPSLANKPHHPQPPAPTTDAIAPPKSKQCSSEKETQKKPFFDPFDNPPQAMLVAPLPPSHNLVLNKFAIVPEHFILATQAFAPQTHLLERADLEVAYGCVEAYHSHALRHGDAADGKCDGAAGEGEGEGEGAGAAVGEAEVEVEVPAGPGEAESGRSDDAAAAAAAASELYVFFNSGPASGSSQPHRHVQLLPVRRMREGLSAEEKRVWPVLAGELTDDKIRGRVPFLTFAERIGGEGVDLEAVYLRLYRRACEAVLGSGEARAAGGGKEARVDYNLAMTRDVMVIAPRVVEGTAVSAVGEDGQRREVGNLALNGSVLAGTALVKTQQEWDALRAEPEQLLELLGRIGVPNIQAPPLL